LIECKNIKKSGLPDNASKVFIYKSPAFSLFIPHPCSSPQGEGLSNSNTEFYSLIPWEKGPGGRGKILGEVR
jgi:hypothetical protein